MHQPKRLYLYPYIPESRQSGTNDYSTRLAQMLSGPFVIVNSPNRNSIPNLLLKVWKTDIIYFNWIEDLPSRKLGWLQIPLLMLVLFIAKCRGTRILWWAHNNRSHHKDHLFLKTVIMRMMVLAADLIGCHSRELAIATGRKPVFYFDHPMDPYQPQRSADTDHDLLIWGTVAPYKGVSQFVRFVAAHKSLQTFRIVIAGRIVSPEEKQEILAHATPNITIIDRRIPDAELNELMGASRWVLFTYNSASVLGSAALSRSLSAGCQVIGPEMGAFKELGERGLVHLYQHLEKLPDLLQQLRTGKRPAADPEMIAAYTDQHSWAHFQRRLVSEIYQRSWGITMPVPPVPAMQPA